MGSPKKDSKSDKDGYRKQFLSVLQSIQTKKILMVLNLENEEAFYAAYLSYDMDFECCDWSKEI